MFKLLFLLKILFLLLSLSGRAFMRTVIKMLDVLHVSYFPDIPIIDV